jgi:L-amino acid N-acyltransferase YncA
MEISFEQMASKHRKEITDIYNYYVENDFSAYPDKSIPYDYYDKFLEMTKGYPAYSIIVYEKIVGFCFLHAYNSIPTFKECAEINYFIDKEFTGKGIGKVALEKLEEEGRKIGIKRILASIASENNQSIIFHQKNGFRECGKFEKIITKKGKQFDIIWMQKDIE